MKKEGDLPTNPRELLAEILKRLQEHDFSLLSSINDNLLLACFPHNRNAVHSISSAAYGILGELNLLNVDLSFGEDIESKRSRLIQLLTFGLNNGLNNGLNKIQDLSLSLEEILPKFDRHGKIIFLENLAEIEKKLKCSGIALEVLLHFRTNVIANLENEVKRIGNEQKTIYAPVFLIEKDDEIGVFIANNGPLIPDGIFKILGKEGTSTKQLTSGRKRGVGLSANAELAKQCGLSLVAYQWNEDVLEMSLHSTIKCNINW